MLSYVMSIKTYRLSELCDIKTGFLPRKKIESDINGNVYVIQLSDADPSLDLAKTNLVKIKSSRYLEKHFLEKGDILFKAKSTNHIAVVFNGDFQAVATHHFFVLRIKQQSDNSGTHPPYIALFINLPVSQAHFFSNKANTHIINKNTLESLEIVVPVIRIQKKAVQIQENLTKQMENHEKIIKHKKELLDLTLNNLLGISNAVKV